MNQNRIRKIGRVESEGDSLYYRVTGEGTPLVLIAGGGGDGDRFLPLADRMADQYKVITYDRRANARSTMNHPDSFSIGQQARDILAIMDELGVDSAYVFGNSSGAVIAMELMRLYPERVRGVIAHEPPVARMHPDDKKWQDFFRSCYRSSFRIGGASMAAWKFVFGIQVPVWQMTKAQLAARRYASQVSQGGEIPKEHRIPSKKATEFLIRKELLPITEYNFDSEFFRDKKNTFVIAAGTYAKENNTFLYQIAEALAEECGSSVEIVPGHHVSFMDDPIGWAERLDEILKRM